MIRNNLIINTRSGGRAFVSKPEPVSRPGNLLIVNNTFQSMGCAVTCHQWDVPNAHGIIFGNNAFFSDDAEGLRGSLRQVVVGGNIDLKDHSEFIDVDLEAGRLDATPRVISRLCGAGDPSIAPERDLNGVSRQKDLTTVSAVTASP